MSGVRVERESLLDYALAIAEEYNGNLTLRQLYYQLVARGHSPNSQKDYKRLGDVVAKARMAGDFPFTWLLDRSRTVHKGSAKHLYSNVANSLEYAKHAIATLPDDYLMAARWWGQPTQVSVWVEKEALAGVFQEPCSNLGVSWFACKGYPSLSSLYEWVKGADAIVESARGRWRQWGEDIERFVILYFGDHDPDGWQIPRTAVETLRQIAEVEDIDLPEIELRRVALNMDQIDRYSPPPFPAKMTSSRYSGYVDEHGTTDAWELDALRPEQLDRLIRDRVNDLFDASIHEANSEMIEERREEMRAKMQEPGWMASVWR